MIKYISDRGCIFIKTFEYNFNYSPPIYDFIMRNIYLSEEKKEKEILDLCRAGKKCRAIGDELGYSERTIQRRRRDLNHKIKDAMLS